MPVSKLNKIHNLYDELYEEFKGFFSTDQLKNLQKCFLKADLDGDHLLNQIELKYWMEKHAKPISQRELRCILKEVDLDHDGFINFREFLTLCLKIGIRKILKDEFPEAVGKEKNVADFSGIISYFEKKAHSESEIRSSTSADYRNRLHELYGSSDCKKLENMFDSETQSLAGGNTDYGTDNDEAGYGNIAHYENHDNSPCCSSESETSVVHASSAIHMHDLPKNCDCCACNYKNEKAIARRHSANENFTHKKLSHPKHDAKLSIPHHHQHRASENHEKINPVRQPDVHDERLENPVHKENNNGIQANGHQQEFHNIYTGNNKYCIATENKRNSVEGNTVGHNNLHSNPPQSHKPMRHNSNGDRHDGENGIPQNKNRKNKDYCLSTTQNQNKYKNSTEIPHEHVEGVVPNVNHHENDQPIAIHPPNPMRHNSNGDHKHEGDVSRIKNEKKNYCLSRTQIPKPKNSKEILHQHDEFVSNSNPNVNVHRNSKQEHHQLNNSPDLRYAEGVHNDHKSHIPIREHGDELKRTEHQNFHKNNIPETHYNPERNYNDKYCQDHTNAANPRKKFIQDTMNDFIQQNTHNKNSINNANDKYCTINIPQRNEPPKYQRNSMPENGHHIGNVRSRRHTTEGYPTHSSPVNIQEHKSRRSYEGEKYNQRNSHENIQEQSEFNRNQASRGYENEFQPSELHRKSSPKNDFSVHKSSTAYSPSEKQLMAEYKTTLKERQTEHRHLPSRTSNADQINRGDKWKQQMGKVLKDIQKKPLEKIQKWEKLAKEEMTRVSSKKDHGIPHQLERHDKYATKTNSNYHPTEHRRSTIEDGHGLAGMEHWEQNNQNEDRKNSAGNGQSNPRHSKEHRRSTIESGHGLAGMQNWGQNKPKEDHKNYAGNGQSSPQHSRQRRSTIEDGHGLAGMENWNQNKPKEERKNSAGNVHSSHHHSIHRRSTIEDGHGLAGMENWEQNKEASKNSAGAENGQSNPPRHSKEHRRSTIEDGHGLARMENWEQNKRRSTIEDGHGLAGMQNWEEIKEARKSSAGVENLKSNLPPRHSKEHRRSTIEDGHGLARMENWEQNKRRSTIEDGHGLAGMQNWEEIKEARKSSAGVENLKSNLPPRHSKEHRRSTIEEDHGLAGMENWEQIKGSRKSSGGAENLQSNPPPRHSKEHRRSTIEEGHGLAGIENWDQNKPEDDRKNSAGNGHTTLPHSRQRRSTIEDGHGLAGMEHWEQKNEDRKNSAVAATGQSNPNPRHSKEHRRSTIEDGHGLAGMQNWEENKESRKNSAGTENGESNSSPRHSKEHRRNAIKDGHGLAGMEHWEQIKEARKNSAEAENGKSNPHPRHSKEHRRSTIEDGHGLAGMENWEENKESRKNSAGTENGESNSSPRHSKEHRRSTIEDDHGLAGLEKWENNATEGSRKNSREPDNRVDDSEEPGSGTIENGKGSSEIFNLEQNQHIHIDENQKHNNEHRDSKNDDKFAVSNVLDGLYIWEANHSDDNVSPRHSKEHRRITIEDDYGLAGMEQWSQNN